MIPKRVIFASLIAIIILFSVVLITEYLSTSFTQSREISNPVDLYFPIPKEEQDGFAELFVNALGDSLIGEARHTEYDADKFSNLTIYKTKEGQLEIRNQFAHYHSNSIIVENPFEMKKFVNDFMYAMGFEFDAENTKITIDYPYTKYYIEKEPIGVEFQFYNSDLIHSTTVYFNGWATDPEIVYTLSEKTAVQKALYFTRNIDESQLMEEFDNIQPHARTPCEFEMIDPVVHKRVTSGIPYYQVTTMSCDYTVSDYGEQSYLLIVLDGKNGENVSWQLTRHYFHGWW